MAKDPKHAGLKQNSQSGAVRLNKYLSECGVVSRRGADDLINEGAVLVNGKKVYELGTKIDPSVDRVTVKGKPVKPTTHRVYILFNKPKNVVTTMSDPEGRPSISDFFERLPIRVFPVGRLDWDTEGMILLTNDGEFAQKVNHPSEDIWKTYLVKLNGNPTEDQLNKLRNGVSILGGRVAARKIEKIRRGAEKNEWVKISISEGKNRQVRRMFEKVGFDVLKLQRVAIGHLRMPGGLKRGEYVFLTEKGLEKIFEQPKPEVKEVVRPRSDKTASRAAESRRTKGARPARAGGARSGSARGGSRPSGAKGARPGGSKSSSRPAGAAGGGKPAGRSGAKSGSARTGSKFGSR